MSNRKCVFGVVMMFLGIGALLACCSGAFAQAPRPGGPPGPPENNEKACAIEATAVAQSLALSPELTTKLADAYKAARASLMAARQASMKPGERPDMAKMREITVAEKTKFETAVKAFLNPEQTTKAVAMLGSGGRHLDPMAMALDGMNLDEKAKPAAWKLVFDYVVASDSAMQAAAASNDMQSVREKMNQLKEKLDNDMAKVLSADQLAKWKEATARGGGMRGGPHGPGGPGGEHKPAGVPAAPAPAPAPAPKPAAK